ncbi:MAG TPA: Smr/MutS family protein [Terriglobia bacterium]|nr:Smr/MutS family protein [Terriglobia bacterium]
MRRLTSPNLAAASRMQREREPIQTQRREDCAVVNEDRGFRRPGIQKGLFRDLRAGRIPIEGELDLHGRTREEARRELERFIETAQRPDRKRAIRIIHGKGLRSPAGIATLRESVAEWLTASCAVLACCEAGPHDGGSGALRALLRARPPR